MAPAHQRLGRHNKAGDVSYIFGRTGDNRIELLGDDALFKPGDDDFLIHYVFPRYLARISTERQDGQGNGLWLEGEHEKNFTITSGSICRGALS